MQQLPKCYWMQLRNTPVWRIVGIGCLAYSSIKTTKSIQIDAVFWRKNHLQMGPNGPHASKNPPESQSCLSAPAVTKPSRSSCINAPKHTAQTYEGRQGYNSFKREDFRGSMCPKNMRPISKRDAVPFNQPASTPDLTASQIHRSLPLQPKACVSYRHLHHSHHFAMWTDPYFSTRYQNHDAHRAKSHSTNLQPLAAQVSLLQPKG